MTPKRRTTRRFFAALVFTAVAVFGGAQAASALGWSTVVECSGGGFLSGRSYRVTFSSAGGNTYLDYNCGGSRPNSGLQIRYQVYPGGPYAYTSWRLQQGPGTAMTQAGTQNGYHKAFNSTGGQVGSVNS